MAWPPGPAAAGAVGPIYSPGQRGARFSANAAMPSRRSADSAAVRQGDPDWLHWIDTCFNVAMHGHQPEIYTAAFEEFFGEKPPVQKPGFPPF